MLSFNLLTLKKDGTIRHKKLEISSSIRTLNTAEPGPRGVDNVSPFIALMNSLNPTQNALFTFLVNVLLPGDHITIVY